MNLFELFVKIGVDDQASKKMDEISQKMGNGLKKATSVGITAIASFGTVAIKTFADFEQLAGGAELMFGDAFETVMENAKNAYKTVQMSQNEYLEQVNGFATGLKTALGGNEQAAADLAHKIVQAEADIVAATGNTAENVQNAFNGIMKSNFTMLDNLQIGITPTKEGFQEVIDKVNEWNEANGRATEYQMGNLADMQSALVDYIEMVGMSGYAQNEAAGTILGSFASMKAAASDFATALIDENGDVGGSFNKLKETAFTFFDNLKPRIMAFLEAISPIATTVAGITGAFVAFKTAASISALLSALIKSWQAYKIANEGATIAQWAMNAAMNANPIVLIVTLIGGLIAALVALWHTNDDFRNALIGAWDTIKNAAVVVWESIVKFFTEDIPNAFKAVINFVKENWQSLLLLITNPIAGALKLLYDLNPKFKEWVDNIWETVTTFFTDIWNDITGFFSKAWEGIKEFLDNPAYYIGYVIGLIFGQITEFFTKTIPDAWNAFTTWLSNGIASIGNGVKKFFTQTIPDVWEGFRNWLSEKFESLKDAIQTFFTETIPNAWDNLKTRAKELFESIGETITNFFTVTIPRKWEDFETNVKEKINSIKDWFKDLPSQLENIGKNIVEGLWDGIKNAWSWLKDKVGGLFGDLVQGIKDGLGIQSPSRLFRDEIGKMMALGLGEGWDDEFREIKKSIDKSLSFDDSIVSIGPSVKLANNGNGNETGSCGGVTVVQNIYSEAKTAADLMQEALYQQERAVLLGV